jgi:hypothetical protein
MNMKARHNCYAVGGHCQVHLSLSPTSKKGTREEPLPGNDFQFKIPVGRAPRRRSTPALGKICAPPDYKQNETTRKVRIDLKNLPIVSIQLPRVSEGVINQYTRSKSSSFCPITNTCVGRAGRRKSRFGRIISVKPVLESGRQASSDILILNCF